MERRNFLRHAMTACIASTSTLAGNAMAGRHDMMGQLKEIGKQATEKLNSRFEVLEARVDKMEHHHRNLLRVGVLGIVISLGIDLTFFL